MDALQRLCLASNCLVTEGVSGAPLGRLVNLTTLILDDNRLIHLPDSLGLLQQLKYLSVNRNMLEALPSALGSLHSLQVVQLRKNRLQNCLPALTTCKLLTEIDLSHNRVNLIPDDVSKLIQLKALNLDANLIAAVPPSVLKQCIALCTLGLHNNPVTAEQLRETDGFAEFEERRQSKYSKQLEMRTMLNRDGFDEGVDVPEWRRW